MPDTIVVFKSAVFTVK